MTAPALRLLTVTGIHGTAHLVTDAAMAADRFRGRYVADRGRAVLAASLTTPETGVCRVGRQAVR